MKLGLTLLVASLCTAAPALAQEAGKDGAKKDKVICKRDRDFATGSHRPAPRTCMKQSEWKELDQHTERLLRESNDAPPSEPTTATGPNPNPGQ